MKYDEIVAAWDVQKVRFHTWETLPDRERIEFALSLAGKVEKQEPVANYSNWHGMCRTHDGQVFRSDPNPPSNVGTVAPCPECEKLKAERDELKQARMNRSTDDALAGQAHGIELGKATSRDEISSLRTERDELAAQVEKMQEALKLSERCFDLIKDVKGPLDWHLILKSELVIKRALSTPDLSTGILNRVRAEALLMAACVIELYGDATLREEDYRLNSAECGDIIRALAADMGAGKCQVY